MCHSWQELTTKAANYKVQWGCTIAWFKKNFFGKLCTVDLWTHPVCKTEMFVDCQKRHHTAQSCFKSQHLYKSFFSGVFILQLIKKKGTCWGICLVGKPSKGSCLLNEMIKFSQKTQWNCFVSVNLSITWVTHLYRATHIYCIWFVVWSFLKVLCMYM